MLNILKIWFFSLLYVLVNLRKLKKIKTLEPLERKHAHFAIIREFSKYILNKLNINIEVIGEQNILKHDNALYIPNHPSMLDPIFLMSILNEPFAFFIADSGKNALKIPVVKQIYKSMDNVYIQRDDLRANITSLKEGTERLNNNSNLIIFPEGNITKKLTNNKTGNFKAGSFKCALNAKKPIIPITILGADNIQKKPSLTSPIVSKDIKIIIHKPIQYNEFKNLTTKETSSLVQNIINNSFK